MSALLVDARGLVLRPRPKLLTVPESQGLAALLGRVAGEGLDFIKTENLYTFDGQRGYSLGQGE